MLEVVDGPGRRLCRCMLMAMNIVGVPHSLFSRRCRYAGGKVLKPRLSLGLSLMLEHGRYFAKPGLIRLCRARLLCFQWGRLVKGLESFRGSGARNPITHISFAQGVVPCWTWQLNREDLSTVAIGRGWIGGAARYINSWGGHYPVL